MRTARIRSTIFPSDGYPITMAKKPSRGQRTFASLNPAPKIPDGCYSGDKPNANLRRFAEEHATPYDLQNDDYNIRAFNRPIETTKATASDVGIPREYRHSVCRSVTHGTYKPRMRQSRCSSPNTDRHQNRGGDVNTRYARVSVPPRLGRSTATHALRSSPRTGQHPRIWVRVTWQASSSADWTKSRSIHER
jgi:hypothetical protein